MKLKYQRVNKRKSTATEGSKITNCYGSMVPSHEHGQQQLIIEIRPAIT